MARLRVTGSKAAYAAAFRRATTLAITAPGSPPARRGRARRHRPWLERQEIPDDELDEQAALEQTWREQRHEPVDLIGAYAA